MSLLSLSQLVVLVVEPSSTQRRIIARALHNSGIETVAECDTGNAALTRLGEDPPDLVISSMYLPDMTGTDLIHQIRAATAYADMPFILISSETRFRYLDPVRQAGVAGILPKPFSDEELKTALATTLDLLDHESDRARDLDSENLKVLVVDDSPLARKHISRVLNALGIEQIDHAEDGARAVDMIAEHYYDFVVTDYNMPHMDGRELVEHIRTSSGQASLPVLMVTSEDNENRLAAVQASGVSAICNKPFEPTTVRNLVRQMVGD